MEEHVKRSLDRILTTHTGSLPRPTDLLELITGAAAGDTRRRDERDARLTTAVAEVVRRQAQCGIDVVSDGEYGKLGFFGYVRDRLAGFASAPPEGRLGQRTVDLDPDFPGFAAWLRSRQGVNAERRGGGLPVCTGPVAWKDRTALEADIANFRRALAGVEVAEAFLPCASVGIIAQRFANRYYPSYEAYVEAIAEAMGEEYRAVADAGFIVQIDAPEMAIDRNMLEFRDRPVEDFRRRMALWVEALNYALNGIPEDRVRLHVCWGNSEAPHTRDVPLEAIIDLMLRVRAGAYSIEASNPRHAHEWRVWGRVRLPAGKVLIPGVIDSVTNFVEHPELVADRILTYARLVGRENVIAGTDCGVGTSASRSAVYPPIVWAKLASLAEGARLASKELWGSTGLL